MEPRGEVGGKGQAAAGRASSAVATRAVDSTTASLIGSGLPVFGHEPFAGHAYGRLEANGRFIIPTEFRYAFTDKVMMVRAQSPECLVAYTPRSFNLLVDSAFPAGNVPGNNPKARQAMFMSTHRLTIDSQSRVVLAAELRNKVPLGDSIVFGGQIEALHIYPSSKFEELAQSFDECDLTLSTHPGLPLDPL